MGDADSQIQNDGQREAPDAQLVGVGGPDHLPAAQGASGRSAESSTRPRPLGARAAANRGLALRRGRGNLAADKEALLGLTGRLIIHFENASNRLYADTETTKDGEPRALLGRLLDLNKSVLDNLRYCFGESAQGADIFAKYRGGQE